MYFLQFAINPPKLYLLYWRYYATVFSWVTFSKQYQQPQAEPKHIKQQLDDHKTALQKRQKTREETEFLH